MNRQQRRANKQKNHDPAFVVKKSNFKEYFNNLLYNDPLVKQAILDEARRVSLEEAKRQDVDILTLILMSLHKREGFGRVRLLRFCNTFNELQKYYEENFEECDLFAMRKHLKDVVGIDVERINEEVKRFLDENPNERHS